MVVDSGQWRCVEAVPAIAFSIDGLGAVREREPATRGWLTIAQGQVLRVERDVLHVGPSAMLTFALPPAISFEGLRGTLVKAALHDEVPGRGPRVQTLRLTGAAGRPLLVARFGPAGQTHSLGGLQLRTSLSQRPQGPMTFGTERLQYVVHVGQHVRLGGRDGEYVVHVAARTAIDYVAYVLVERTLWISDRR
jgi:hypothetical protein